MKRKKNSYDSKFEELLHLGPLKGWLHHSDKILYSITKKYEPDFKHPTLKDTYIEAKGRFRTSEEASKYVWFIKSNPHIKLIFVFSDPDKPMPNSKVRKDGTRATHSEWADKNGFEWRYYKL